jgi:hypothetical protein
MNLKVEDLEREINQRGVNHKGASVDPATTMSKDDIGESEAVSSRLGTINPQSFVLQSMKEALASAEHSSKQNLPGLANLSLTASGGTGGLL